MASSDRNSFLLATGEDKLLWLQVINRAARSVSDEGIASFRMKDADEICCRRSVSIDANIQTVRVGIASV